MKLKVDHSHEYVIAVLAPREKTTYRTVMANVIKSIGTAENLSDAKHDHFVFIHDGVTSGTTGYVIETINKIEVSAKQYTEPKIISYRKLALNIEEYGRRSQYNWVDEALALKPDIFVVFDHGNFPVAQYAQREAKRLGIACDVHKVQKES